MAAGNPALYGFLYEAYFKSDLNKETLFGLLVGMYHMLEMQLNEVKK
jgi:hypothetical protein